MRALPLLEARRTELEKCVFCPKLCRSACPVSNAEPRETVTPWGKMSSAWMTAHGDVPLDPSHARPAWACTGCLACQESCDHRNPVARVLLDARDALTRRGVAPEAAQRVLRRFDRHNERTRAAARRLASAGRVRRQSDDALLIGCGYLRAARREAGDAVDAAAGLLGPTAIVEECCGLPLLLAGDGERFLGHARALARSLKAYRRVIVLDAGCALGLSRSYAEAGVSLAPKVELLVRLAASRLSALAPVVPSPAEPVRWHDPCQLGRGMGIYDEPRSVLARLLGRPPAEFEDNREQAICSGGGGLLPSTMPEVARTIAGARLDAHARAGRGRVVTACASSLIALRSRARGTGVAVDDLVTWIARGLRAGKMRGD
jgi:Fe-S oxidoreductase